MYKLEDLLSLKNRWYIEYQSDDYYFSKNLASYKWRPIKKGQEKQDVYYFDSADQAKMYLVSKYNVPLTGWKINIFWKTTDYKWTFKRVNKSGSQWKIHHTELGWQKPYFKTRSEALEWINDFEKDKIDI